MSDGYQYNLEYRAKIDAEIISIVHQFQSGALALIATARALSPYFRVVEGERPDLASVLIKLVGVDSETDSLVIGPPREIWHPSTLSHEDEKVRMAEKLYQEGVSTACSRILRILSKTE